MDRSSIQPGPRCDRADLKARALPFLHRLHSAPGERARRVLKRMINERHSWPMPPSFLCGVGAAWGVPAGCCGRACTGGSIAFDGGALRWRGGASCGVGAPGSGVVCTGGGAACDGAALPWPKLGFCALHSATSCRSICGKGLLVRRGCVRRMMGAMQSTKSPSPVLAPPCTNPACSHAALISAQGRRGWAACPETAALKLTSNEPRTAALIRFRCISKAPCISSGRDRRAPT